MIGDNFQHSTRNLRRSRMHAILAKKHATEKGLSQSIFNERKKKKVRSSPQLGFANLNQAINHKDAAN